MNPLTPEKIAAMGDEERLGAFRIYGEIAFGKPRFFSEFARRSGWAESTVSKWSGGFQPVPVPAVVLVMEWALGKTNEQAMLEAMQETAAAMQTAARSFNTAFTRISRNLEHRETLRRDAER